MIISVFRKFHQFRCFKNICRSYKMEDIVKNIFYAAVDSVKPCELITKNKILSLNKIDNKEVLVIKQKDSSYQLDITDKNLHIVGFGKGVLTLAKEVETVLADRIADGILSVPVGATKIHTLSVNSKIKIYEGANQNLPDYDSLKAAEKIKNYVSKMTDKDILFCLITGGGSACLPLPEASITLDEKATLIKKLSRSGATINELNVVRIAMSQLKGGKLARKAKNAHKIISLIISDIINDPLWLIASGPTIEHQKTATSPQNILEKYNLMSTLPPSIAQVIQKNGDNQDGQMAIKNSQVFLIGNNRIAIDAAMNKAKTFNLIPVFLSHEVQGDVIDISKAFFDLVCVIKSYTLLSHDEFINSVMHVLEHFNAQPNFVADLIEALNHPKNGICIVSGGETTVAVKCDDGYGGRNQELALRFTKLCHDDNKNAGTSSYDDLLFLSAGSDGIDGNNDAAGAIGGLRILSRIEENNQTISDVMAEYIYRNDSYNFYKNFIGKHAGDGYHIHSGITGTNIMDIHLLLMIMPKARLS